jgi:hypothetical protein
MRTRQIAVAAAFAVSGAAVAALGMGGTSFAQGLITGDDIQDGSITGRDIRDHSIGARDLSFDARRWLRSHGGGGGGGGGGDHGHQGSPGQPGQPGRDATYVGPHWGLIDRNITAVANAIGHAGGYAALRSGPFAGTTVKPPSGIGSLQIQTPTGDDKVDFGNEVDFLGNPLSGPNGLNQVAFDVYTSQENIDAGGTGNLPNIHIEVDVDGPAGSLVFSTLVFDPDPVTPGSFTHINAATSGHWYFTRSNAASAVCGQNTNPGCTFAQAKAAAPAATILSISVGKGRDHAFAGAVDDLQINRTVYDFEPFGVYARPAT